MQNIFENYIQSISSKFSHEETSEMGYRTDFEILIKKIFESIVGSPRIDHDAKANQGNKPDFVVINHDVPILYIEAKDIGVSLDRVEKSEQMDRYYGYTNLVLTDYVEFRFYRNGLRYEEPIKIANYDMGNRTITPIPENYEHAAKTLVGFTQSHKEPIRSGEHLAKIMGGIAQRIRDDIRQFYSLESDKNTDLIKLYVTIKRLLVNDLTIGSFADMYAQTLVYGLFVARYYDKSQDNFSRQEARELIPNSNPLLRHFFDHIVGADFDNRLKFIVDELCEVFSHANIEELMKEYFKVDLWGKTHRGPDPVIHFYEDFLNEYDPILRKKMGAYYTPLPVVEFIVRSVNYLLKKEFGLAAGLADTSKTKDGLHKVQILDPACGTGTFISSVIRSIYIWLQEKGQKGRWPAYVHNDLLPRLYGFELMMAPYTIAHLKLGIAFRQTGFWDFHRRLGIYLTNSLEETSIQQQEMFAFGLAESIVEESKEAIKIKNEKPIMVVIGNPPYSGESSNKKYNGHDVYKVEPSGGKLKEKNSKWINDDYVKFIRLAESMIEKTREGIVAMITAHGYIDNPTFRGMRWHLMKAFDEIYVLDLHGNTNKKEKSPDGTEDKNVFDIKTGVAIFIGIKKKDSKSSQAKIYRADLYGKRFDKFTYLNENMIGSVKWSQITPLEPTYEWVARDEGLRKEYHKGFSLKNLFKVKNTGIVTKRDKLCIQNSVQEMWNVVQNFINLPEHEVRQKYNIPDDVRDWKFEWAKKDLLTSGPLRENIIPVSYRPFDTRFTYYTGNSRGFVGWPIKRITSNYLKGGNIGLLTTKANRDGDFSHVFVTPFTSEVIFLSGITASNAINFPLYLYSEEGIKESNLNDEIVNQIKEIIGEISPLDIFDYIYAILYSPSYRKKYKEFLKIDFPYVPYPKDVKTFKKLVEFGSELRSLHLLESSKVNQFITTYPIAGSNIIENPNYKEGKVFINESQYFGKVPESTWNFYVGGYQPAQKWLKSHKNCTLTNEEIEHYQKMIVALAETDRIMKEIDKAKLIN
ncbi:MAG: type ISP restriction/modification enzyme [bacterium]|nr:type ISP restriction/modification enzyme [bacterium]